MKFPPNFSKTEMTRSRTARKLGIDNTPSEQEERNLIRVAWFLQTLRDKLARHCGSEVKLFVSSGYRSARLNSAIKGSKTSAHLHGLAADITCSHLDPYRLAKFIVTQMVEEGFDQVIHEFGRWVHVGLADGEMRQQVLTARKNENGRTEYVPTLTDEV